MVKRANSLLQDPSDSENDDGFDRYKEKKEKKKKKKVTNERKNIIHLSRQFIVS